MHTIRVARSWIRHASAQAAACRTDHWTDAVRTACLLLPLLVGDPAVARLNAQDLSSAEKLHTRGDYGACLAVASEAVEKGIWNERWWQLKLRAEMTTGQYAAALATLEDGLERYPASVVLHWLGHQVYRMNDKPAEAEKMLVALEKVLQQSNWGDGDPRSRLALGRYFLHRGADPARVMELFYDRVRKEHPDLAEACVAAGELALDKHDYQLAAESLERAAELAAEDPHVHYLLARAYWSSDPTRAAQELETALEKNPRHVDSLLLTVDRLIDAERFDEAHALLGQALAVNPHEPRGWAYRAVLAHLECDGAREEEARKNALRCWSTNPEVDHLIGRKLSQNYRFAEGAAGQRRALEFDPDYVPAKMQLCQDLLRLGDDQEGWRLAEQVFAVDQYSVVAHNLLALHDVVQRFRTLERDGVIVRMDAREAEIFGRQALDLLCQAKETLCAKYDATIEHPTVVELFPEQKDFAIRTFGLPGGAGFLGVCFGRVITANSPASQGASPTNWQALLWHEYCHTVTLAKTNNRMPRWLSEGISVYEEKQRNATWGQTMTPRYRQMILDDELTPISQLSSAFLKPPTPLHLQFAYFESSLVVEFLVEKHGLETLKQILADLGRGTPINVALALRTSPLPDLEHQFAEFARNKAQALAPQADWQPAALPPDADLATLRQWNAQHPDNYWGLHQLAEHLLDLGQWQEAKEPLARLRTLYPFQTGISGCLGLLARVHRELGETDLERQVLEERAAIESDAVDVYLRLLEICDQGKEWEDVAKYGQQMLAVNPLLPEPHRYMARAAEGLGVTDVAIDAYRALLLMDPVDPAEVHFRLAFWLERRGEIELARRHVLQSLEEAPRFRAAHGLLLKLHEASPGPADSGGSPPAPGKGQEQHTERIEEGSGKSDAHRAAKEAGK